MLVDVTQQSFWFMVFVWRYKACCNHEIAAGTTIGVRLIKCPPCIAALVEINMRCHEPQVKMAPKAGPLNRVAAPETDALAARLGYLRWRPG